MLKVLAQAQEQEEAIGRQTVDDLAREGARRMLVQALELEVAAYLERYPERDAGGHALVVRNGKARARKVMCGAGTLTVAAPRVNDWLVVAQGQRQRVMSPILTPYMLLSPKSVQRL